MFLHTQLVLGRRIGGAEQIERGHVEQNTSEKFVHIWKHMKTHKKHWKMQPESGNIGNLNLEMMVLGKTKGEGPPENQENQENPENTSKNNEKCNQNQEI